MAFLKQQMLSLVVVGDFNPAIFHPSWLAKEKLMRSDEIETATIEIIHREAAFFKVEWLDFKVISDRFSAATLQEQYFEPLRDLVFGIFTKIGPTPIRLMGINLNFDYRLESETIWHKIGHTLAPKKYWEPILKKPGLFSLIVANEIDKETKSQTRVRLEPSKRAHPGLFIEVNNHFDLRINEKDPSGPESVIDIIKEKWTETMQKSKMIGEHLASLEANL